MKLLLGVILFLSATVASAREYTFSKKIEAGRLQSELRSAGFQVDYITCLGEKCRIIMPDKEKKNPKAIIDAHKIIDRRAQFEARLAKARPLAKKMIDGTISPQEKDELLKMLAIIILRMDE
ncbi:MAG: hypothetical protein WCU88_02455 [Elusimicrobiota bacterium]|jgi:hypothetical protein